MLKKYNFIKKPNWIFHIKILQDDKYEYKLLKHLLLKYNKYARPTQNHTDITNVSLSLSLAQLIDVVRS